MQLRVLSKHFCANALRWKACDDEGRLVEEGSRVIKASRLVSSITLVSLRHRIFFLRGFDDYERVRADWRTNAATLLPRFGKRWH